MHTISYSKLTQLGQLIERRREKLGWSAREAARRTGMHVRSYQRYERGQQPRPTTQGLNAIADALDLPVSDLFATLGWLPNADLPSLRPYLQAKYSELPEAAMAEIDIYFENLSRKYNLTEGPAPGEDESEAI